MNPVIEAIKSRRSVRKMRPDPPVGREEIESIIEAGIWAPNHYLTEPWRFVVFSGEELAKLGNALSDSLAAASTAATREQLEAEKNRPLTASAIIALISSPKSGERIVPQEEIVAAGASLQNMLLAADSLGIAAMVRTGAHSYSEIMRKFFGMSEVERLVGLIYLGRVAEAPPPGRRTGTAGKVIWRGAGGGA